MTKFEFMKALGIAAAASLALTACTVTEIRTSSVTTTTAVPNAENPDAVFTALDKDRDGFLSRSEVDPIMRVVPATAAESPYAVFNRLDTNRDGFLSRAEATPLVSSARFVSGIWTVSPWPPVGVTIVPPGSAVIVGPR